MKPEAVKILVKKLLRFIKPLWEGNKKRKKKEKGLYSCH